MTVTGRSTGQQSRPEPAGPGAAMTAGPGLAQRGELEWLVQQVMGAGVGVRPETSPCRWIGPHERGSRESLREPTFRCTLPEDNWRSLPKLYRQLRGQGYRFDATRIPGGGQELRIWRQRSHHSSPPRSAAAA